ncbi:putative purine nucleoside phosphorylase [Lasiodiplodia hormozganensis]|uniref:purine-nucleoside phosphorylase n=1 Tax=Lasiodiplodia hormozganensis TaxID=869390 RepID=A0AA40D6L0_9PEZI|nr:putative purine nucleoside phosphorylase [Lasiodiplodia hormozganensis]
MKLFEASGLILGLLHSSVTSALDGRTTPPPLLNFSSPAPYIFSSINGLLQQWSNSFFPNGHTIAACDIPAHTLLYHGRHDADLPPSPEWLAFDVEMAYGIMGNLPDSRMLTYRTTRAVKCLYFDGMSANLMSDGVESQMTFLYGDSESIPSRPHPGRPGRGPPRRGPPPEDVPGHGDGGRPPFGHWNPLDDEYFRAEGLCRWIKENELGGQGWGLEGIVRMNAGFELIWCDFDSPSLRLMSNLNVSAPRIQMEKRTTLGEYAQQQLLDLATDQTILKGAANAHESDSKEGPHGPGMTDPSEPFRGVANWMWFTAAARRYGFSGSSGTGTGRGEARVRINTCGIFTFYDPGLEDHDRARIEDERAYLNISDHGSWHSPEHAETRAVALEQLLRRRRSHRPNHVSQSDGKYMKDAMERRMHAVAKSDGGFCSNIDWKLSMEEVVTFYGANLRNLLQTLEEIPEPSEKHWLTVREWLESVRVLTHWFMMPFLEYPRGPYTNESLKVDFDLDSPMMQEAMERCQGQYGADDIKELGDGEKLLSWSIDETLGGICRVLFKVGLEVEYEWLSYYNLDPEKHGDDSCEQPVLGTGREWKMAVEELMAWLGWVEQWTGCEGPCGQNEICYIPMWPAMSNGIRSPRNFVALQFHPAYPAKPLPAMSSDNVVAAPGAVYKRATETAQFLKENVPAELRSPKVAIVCGSGLGGLAETIHKEPVYATPYANIPNFPQSTVVLLVGRAHFYEGHAMDMVTFATRVCKVLGVETMIVTNAAGGLNPEYAVGDIVCLNDHLNFVGLAGFHSLRGPNADEFGPRFPPLSDAYDLELRQRVHKAWKKLGLDKTQRKLHEGVYAFVTGPSYETRAECRLLRTLGADVVGMSTVPEIVVARHCGIRVLAFSLVTNKAVLEAGPRGDDPAIQDMNKAELDAYLSKGKANHEEVLEAGREAAKDMQELVKQVLSDLGAA